jgi:predicted permease
MRALIEWTRRLWGTIRKHPRDADMEEELKLHLELAREDGKLHAGGLTQAMDAMRDQRGLPWLEDLAIDVRYAVRLLRRTPAFTVVAILSLALGIGANTAVFSLLNAVVLRTLPVAHPRALVQLVYTFPAGEPSSWNSYFGYPQLDRFRSESRTLSGIFGGTSLGRVAVDLDGQTGLAICDAYTGNMFSVLGLTPQLGRFFTSDEDRDDTTVAVLSDRYWRSGFGADPSIVGRSITIDRLPFTIVGVAPAGFGGLLVGASRDVWVPLHALSRFKPDPGRWSAPFTSWLTIVGRLRDGVTRQQAESELDVLYRRLAAEQLAASDRQSSEFEQRMVRDSHLLLHSAETGTTSGLRHTYEMPLELLLAVAGIVLLIACANVANLMLARASHRRHEIALRMALGSGRGRIVRQLLTESLLLAAAGGLAALAVAWWGGGALIRMVSTGDTPVALDIHPDWRVLVFTAGLTLISGILFGLAPALRGTRVDPGPAVKDGGRGTVAGPRRLDHVLVVAQVTLSIVLVSGAAMFTRSLQKLREVDVGYDRENILMLSTDAGLASYPKERAATLYRLMLEKLSRLPGVASAAASVVRPIDDQFYLVDRVDSIDGRRLPERDYIRIAWNSISPGYFSTIGTSFTLGRDFDPGRDACAFMCIIINESLARKAFPAQNPIGHRLSDAEIIGVVRDSHYNGIQDQPRPVIYRPLFQPVGAFNSAAWINAGVSFELRYRVESGLVDEARQAVASVDRSLPIFRIKTLQAQTDDSLLRERLLVALSNGFGGLALVLACLGLYGMMAYSVARRTAEIGVRMALGASRREIVWLVLRGSLVLVGIGALVGIPLSVWASRFARSLLFEVTPAMPLLVVTPVVIMFVIAGVAGYLPARRASRVDPVIALRCE